MVRGWVGSRVGLDWPVKMGWVMGQPILLRVKNIEFGTGIFRVGSGQKILTCFVMSIHEALLLLYSIKSWETLLQSHVTGVLFKLTSLAIQSTEGKLRLGETLASLQDML